MVMTVGLLMYKIRSYCNEIEGLREDPYHWTELPSLNKKYYHFYYYNYVRTVFSDNYWYMQFLRWATKSGF